ncbi:CLUMA_CG016439, isoform A [Clunio marinus]|uniref:CLUMA_CG016439, isoform A n=1 Tax=Clunio marinus TaxID=568069 RepID=A0A1J1ISR8_9DIPT|nr:CLUMA_CG016439, isoform A [Clunio marinus]
METDYDKNARPSELTEVSISLKINRISSVDENKEEISFDVFLQVVWMDKRIKVPQDLGPKNYSELTMDQRNEIWVPDLYIRQLREMKILKVFEEISSLRIYENSTISLSIGATIIIKCDMDFVLYPLDVQSCPVDFSSYKYTVNEMAFYWRKDHPLTFPNDFGENGFRLPKYVVSFQTHEEPLKINPDGDADRISARLDITLSREVKSYLLENYLPSTLFTVISWGSFLIIPTIVPGRMVLLVTTLLSLVTMFDGVRNNSPDALELKCIEVWLLSCTFFVFLALMEYFVVLFGIRYDSHWRRSQLVAAAAHAHHQQQQQQQQQQQSQSPSRIHLSNQSLQATLQVPSPAIPNLPNVETPLLSETRNEEVVIEMTTLQPQRRNGLENAARMFQVSKINPEEHKVMRDLAASRAESLNTAEKVSSIMGRRRFRNVADVALLYAGSTRGKLDQISLILFPVSFVLFTVIYWVLYINESRKSAL